MKSFGSALCTFALLFGAAAVNANAQQPVGFPSGDSTAHGLLYLPAGHGPHPALILIHEWWGLNDWVTQQAARYSGEGYVVLAVDLYRGKVATDTETAHELMRGLPQDQGVRDLVSAVHFIEARKDVQRYRVGAVGWCMGGTYAALIAVAAPSLRAVAINYGALPTEKSQLAKIHAAILGNFGALDQGIPPQAVHAFQSAMESLGKHVDVKIYPDAGHAFENPNNTAGYKPQDAADAISRMDAFFAAKLKR